MSRNRDRRPWQWQPAVRHVDVYLAAAADHRIAGRLDAAREMVAKARETREAKEARP